MTCESARSFQGSDDGSWKFTFNPMTDFALVVSYSQLEKFLR